MNTRIPHHWNKYMFGMQPSSVGGIPKGLLMELNFKSWRICFVFGTFVPNNGEDI
jgi:hypothetical protein